MMNKKIEIRKLRDDALIEKFCSKGTYTGAKGEIVGGVCKTVPMQELLDTLHKWDVAEDEATKENENLIH